MIGFGLIDLAFETGCDKVKLECIKLWFGTDGRIPDWNCSFEWTGEGPGVMYFVDVAVISGFLLLNYEMCINQNI